MTSWLSVNESEWLFDNAAGLIEKGGHAKGYAAFYIDAPLSHKTFIDAGVEWTATCKDHHGQLVTLHKVFTSDPDFCHTQAYINE